MGVKGAVDFGEATSWGLHSNSFLLEAENLLHQWHVHQHQFPRHKPTYKHHHTTRVSFFQLIDQQDGEERN